MLIDEVKFIWSLLAAAGAGGLVAGAIFFVVTKYYLAGYLTQKAKNLADKEDIRHLTEIVEKVKLQSSQVLEGTKFHNQLRVAALDRRLEAAQQAYSLWRELMRAIHTADIAAATMKCQTWWTENCLFLSADARSAFSLAYSSAGSHASLLSAGSNAEIIKANFRHIVAAGEVITKSVELPGFTQAERAEMADALKQQEAFDPP